MTGTFLVAHWVRLCAPSVEGPVLITGQETRPHMLQLRVHATTKRPHMPQLRPSTAK